MGISVIEMLDGAKPMMSPGIITTACVLESSPHTMHDHHSQRLLLLRRNLIFTQGIKINNHSQQEYKLGTHV